MAGKGRRGSVRQEPNGSWSLVVDATEAGAYQRNQTRRRGFATRREAQAALTKILRDLATQTYVPPSRQTFGDFLVDDWLPAVECTLRPATFDSYRRNVRLHLAGRPIGRTLLQRLDGGAFNAHYALLLAGTTEHPRLAPRSVVYIHVIAHRALRDAVRWDRLVRNPADAADPPKPSKRHRSTLLTWSADDLRRYLEATRHLRLHAAWRFLAMTGARRGEALGLTWRALDLDAGLASIRRTLVTTEARRHGAPGMAWSEPKTDKGWRTLALDPDTVTVLRAHLARQQHERRTAGATWTDHDLVFCTDTGHPIHPKTLSYYFAQSIRKSGAPRIRLHDLRHTHATLALRAGIHPRVVQERLGHANVGITLDTYSHVSLPMQADAALIIAAAVAGARGEHAPRLAPRQSCCDQLP
jgi:integrase